MSQESPSDYGWSRVDDILQPVWFEGPELPRSLRGEETPRGNAEDRSLFEFESDGDIDIDTDAWSDDSDSDGEL